jgi:hypothetical protein
MVMTENEWLTGNDLRAMLSHVRSGANLTRSKPGRRKMRLFACGCCRHVWDMLPDDKVKKVLAVCEQYADGEADDKAREAALLDANRSFAKLAGKIEYGEKASAFSFEAARAVWAALDKDGRQAVEFTLEYTVKAAQAAGRKVTERGQKGKVAEAAADALRIRQAALLRELFGNPFHPVTFPAAWKSANVLQLAGSIYKEQAFDRMPVLGDALEETGCTESSVLEHCRDAGPHFLGCWVLDGILGR